MEVGERGRLYTYRYTVTTRMTPALRWAAMSHLKVSLIVRDNDESSECFINCEGQSHKTVSTNHNLFEEKGEPKRIRTEVPLLTSLTPYRQAKPAHNESSCMFHLTTDSGQHTGYKPLNQFSPFPGIMFSEHDELQTIRVPLKTVRSAHRHFEQYDTIQFYCLCVEKFAIWQIYIKHSIHFTIKNIKSSKKHGAQIQKQYT